MLRPTLASFVLLAACQQEPTVPKLGDAPVSLSVSVSEDSLTPGQPDTIRVTATNNLDQGVRLEFPSTCTIVVTIRNQPGQVVLTDDDSECIRLRTVLTFQPRGTITRTYVWKGGSEFVPPETPRLPPGAYFVSASMNAFGYSTFAPALKVQLLP